MKITATQLRKIIAEEVEKVLQHEALQDHERPDESLVNLSLGMKKWLTPTGMAAGWDQITAALQDLFDVMGMTEPEVMDEINRIADELGYSEDDLMDLEASVTSWMQGH